MTPVSMASLPIRGHKDLPLNSGFCCFGGDHPLLGNYCYPPIVNSICAVKLRQRAFKKKKTKKLVHFVVTFGNLLHHVIKER